MSTTPQFSELPRLIEPRRLARQSRSLKGQVSGDRCERLPEMVERIQPLQVSLDFFEDDQGQCCMQGEISTAVTLVCQRCLEPVEIVVTAKPDVLVVRSEDQVHGRESDFLVVADELTDLIALLEDEIILGLPLVAMHPPEDCHFPTAEEQLEESVGEGSKDNPFKILASLKDSHQ